MSWTLAKWNNLVSTSALGLAALYGCSKMPDDFRHVYRRARRRWVTAGPPGWVFGWVWPLVGVLLIAGSVLFALNYETCDSRYYLAAQITILAHFVLLCAWSMVFWGARSAVGGFTILVLIFGTGVATVVLFALVANSSCPVRKTEAWVAFGLWLAPHLWYVWALVMNWQWMQIPRRVMREFMRLDSEVPLTQDHATIVTDWPAALITLVARPKESEGHQGTLTMFTPVNTRQEEIRQKLALLDDPDRIGGNPWLNADNPEAYNVRDDERNCRWTAWFPIPLGRQSPWEASSQALGDFQTNSQHWELPWMLQFILMGAEDHDLGTPSFAVAQKTHPALWRKVIETFVEYRHHNDRRKETVELLKMFFRRSPMFDPAVSEMIDVAKEVVRARRLRRQGGGDDDDDNDVIDPSMRGGVPARQADETAQQHQINIEIDRMRRRHRREVDRVCAQNPEWSRGEAEAYVREQDQRQGERAEDDAFDGMMDEEWGENEEDDDLALIENEEPGLDAPETPQGQGAPGGQEGDSVRRRIEDEVDATILRQTARQRLNQRNAAAGRVEAWCQTLPGIGVFHVYGGQLATTHMEMADRRYALQHGRREPGWNQENAPDHLEGVPWERCTQNFLPWPLRSCPNPPMFDVSDVLPQGVETSLRDADEVFGRQCDAESKVVTKLFVFDGEHEGEKHCLLGIGIRDDIEYSQLVHKIVSAHRHRSAREGKGMVHGRRGFAAWTDPYQHLSRFKNFHPAFTYSQETYIKACQWFLNGTPTAKDMNRAMISCNQFSDLGSKFHPHKVCTLKFALDVLRRAKAKLGGLTENDFLSAVGSGNGDKNMTYTMHTPPQSESWRFHPLQVFWYHRRWLGLSQTLFPFRTKSEDLCMRINTGRVRITLEDGIVDVEAERAQEEEENRQRGMEEDCMSSTNPNYDQEVSRGQVVVDKTRYMRNMPVLLPYRHGDVLVHYEAENRRAWKKVEALLPDDPLKDPEGYDQYCRIVEEYREGNLNKFCSIWRTDGVVHHLPTNASHKSVMMYGKELLDRKNNPKRLVTCHLDMLDPDMTPWGNAVVSKMTLLAKGLTIINCKIPFLAGGLLMTFDRDRPGKLRPNIQLCGPADVGKTFPFLDFIKLNYIRGTWDDQHRSSNKSKNIHTHFPPQMLLCDEPPKWVTDAKAEEKHYEEVQAMKQATVTGEHTYSVFTTVEHNGENIRTTDDVKTKDPRTLGFCTNQPRDKDHPLATRFLMISVPRPTKPPEDYQYEPGKLFPGEVRKFFHTEQFLLVELMTASRIGVVPDVDMWLFKAIMRRMISILRTWNVLDRRKGYRPVQIMEPYVRYETYVRAIVCARHVPGGVLYNKPYDPRDVAKIAPYMVPTLEIIKHVINMCREELIDEDARIVAMAFCEVCRYNPELTPLENFELEMGDDKLNIPWRRHRNPDFVKSKEQESEPEFLVNLNEICMYGRVDHIAQTLAPRCKGLSVKQVTKILLGLTKRSIRMRNNKRYVRTARPYIGSILKGETVEHDGVAFQPTEEDIMTDCDWVNAATFTNQEERDGSFYLNPSLLWVLQDDVIERAWLLATMHIQYPRGKFISGRIMDDHPDLFEVDIYTDHSIEAYCKLHDFHHPDAPLPRSKGLAITNRAQLTEFEQQLLKRRVLDPASVDRHFDIFDNICKNRGNRFVEIKDLELLAAQRAAYRAGDRSGIFYTDDKVIELYEAYLEKHPELVGPQMRYPSNVVIGRNEGEQDWKRNNQQLASTHDILGQLKDRNIRFRHSMDEQEAMGRIRRSSSSASLASSSQSSSADLTNGTSTRRHHARENDPGRSRDRPLFRRRQGTKRGRRDIGQGRVRVTFVGNRSKRAKRALQRASGGQADRTPDHGGPERMRRAMRNTANHRNVVHATSSTPAPAGRGGQ